MTKVLDSDGAIKQTPTFVPGMIITFYGATLPEGFALCDGNNGTPDLRDRFIVGNAVIGLGAGGGSVSPTAALTHTGAAVGNHSAHGVTQPVPHSDHVTTQAADHSDHVTTQAADHGIHDLNATHCLDEETELLTRSGWKRWDQLSVGEVIATFDIQSRNNLHWQDIQGIRHGQDHPWMIEIQGRRTFISACSEHRMIYRRPNRSWQTIRMEDLPRHCLLPTAGMIQGHDNDSLTPEMYRVLGWVIAEGHFAKKNRNGVILYQKADNAWRVREALSAAGLSWKEGTYGNEMVHLRLDTPSSLIVRSLLPEGKQIPASWIGQLSTKNFDVLLEALVQGDGRITDKTFEYVSSNELHIDRLQALGALHGFHTLKSPHFNGRGGSAWQLRLRPKPEIYFHAKMDKRVVPYSGTAWCVTVKAGSIVSRRDGQVLIVGNTHDAHTTSAALAGTAAVIADGFTHNAQGAHTHGIDAHVHTGGGVDAHSAHASGAVDAHSVHSGTGVDAHSVHSVTQPASHAVLKHYLLAYAMFVG